MIKATVSMLIGLLLTVLSGCSVLDAVAKNENELAVKYATLKVLERGSINTDRVVNLISEAKTYVKSDDSILVSALVQGARERLIESNLSYADKLLIQTILSSAQERIEDRLGADVLDKDRRLKLLTILQWIEEAAESRSL